MKTILLSLVLLISISTFSENLYFHAISGSFKFTEESDFRPPVELRVPVYINYDRKHIEIHTDEVQIIDYVEFTFNKTAEGDKHWRAVGMDSKYQKVIFHVIVLSTGEYVIMLDYPKFSVIYELQKQ